MNFWKKHILKVFFTYFLVYVLSPFCYMGNQPNENTIIASKTRHDTRNIRVIWELVFSEFFQPEDANDSSSDVRFLIKKARAVLRTDNILKISQSELTVSASEDDSINFLEPLIPLLQFTKLYYKAGFYTLFSGLSPPSV